MKHLTPCRRRATLTLALSLVLSFAAGLSAQTQQPPPGGGPPPPGAQTQQPPPGGGQSQAVDAAAQADPNDVLKASGAREIAAVSCTTAADDSCLNKTLLDPIAKNFNAALLGPDGKDSSGLAKAVKAFLDAPIQAPDGSKTVWDRKAAKYALVHLVKYDAKGAAHDKWLLATAGKSSVELSESLHIPGAHTIALVFVHLNEVVNVADPKNIKVDEVLPQVSNISYRAIVEKKLPINVQNLLALLRLSAGILQDKTVQAPVGVVGFGVITHVAVPSDVTVFGVRLSDTSSKLIGQSQKYDNEGKYWWDASVAVPVNKLTLLDYSSDNGGLFTPKTINKQSIYGIINLYPDLVDLKYGNRRWLLPRAIAGIGLTGRPGENFIFGGAWGIQQLQFFVGSAWANHRVLLPGSDPKTGSSYTQRYSSQLSFGINVPVLSAIKKMAGSGKSNSGNDLASAAGGTAAKK